MIAVAETRSDVAIVRKPLHVTVLAIGLFMFAASAWSASKDLPMLGTLDTARSVLLPVLLSLTFLPFVYVFVVYAKYETLFIRVGGLGGARANRSERARMQWLLVKHVGVRLADVDRFASEYGGRLWGCATVHQLEAFLRDATADPAEPDASSQG
jgi:hypothetical protein